MKLDIHDTQRKLTIRLLLNPKLGLQHAVRLGKEGMEDRVFLERPIAILASSG